MARDSYPAVEHIEKDKLIELGFSKVQAAQLEEWNLFDPLSREVRELLELSSEQRQILCDLQRQKRDMLVSQAERISKSMRAIDDETSDQEDQETDGCRSTSKSGCPTKNKSMDSDDDEEERELPPNPFRGTEDPIAADRWLCTMNRNLKWANLASSREVPTVGLQLFDRAASWWLNLDEPVDTWAQFTALFKKKYIPSREVNRIKRQFNNFQRKSTETAEQYVDAFAERVAFIGRHSTSTAYSDDHLMTIFLHGLPLESRARLSVHIGSSESFKDFTCAFLMIETIWAAANKPVVEKPRPQQRRKTTSVSYNNRDSLFPAYSYI